MNKEQLKEALQIKDAGCFDSRSAPHGVQLLETKDGAYVSDDDIIKALRGHIAELEKELLEFAKDVLANDNSKYYKNNQPRPLDGRKLPGWRRWATPFEMAQDLLKRHGVDNPIGTVTDEEKANENYIVIGGVTYYKDQDKKWLEEHGYLKALAEQPKEAVDEEGRTGK